MDEHDRIRLIKHACELLASNNPDDQMRGLELLHSIYSPVLAQFARRSLRTRIDNDPTLTPLLHDIEFHADNLEQRAWVIILRKIDQFEWPHESECDAKFRNWVSSIAANISWEYGRNARNFYLHNAPLDGNDDDDDDDFRIESLLTTGACHSFEDELIRHETIALLWQAIRMLDDDEYELVVQRFFGSRSYKEIALSMGRAEGALRVMWSRRVSKKLRRLMIELGGEEGDGPAI